MPAPIAATTDRENEARYMFLLIALEGEACYLHAKSKLSYPYNFAAVVESLHASVRAVRAQQQHTMLNRVPSAEVTPIATLLSDPVTSQPHQEEDESPASTFYAGQKQYGRPPQSILNNPQGPAGEMRRFNCERATRRISSCTFPKDREKIQNNLDAWRNARRISSPSSRLHLDDLEHLQLSPSLTNEVLLASNLLNGGAPLPAGGLDESPPIGLKLGSTDYHVLESDADIFLFHSDSFSYPQPEADVTN